MGKLIMSPLYSVINTVISPFKLVLSSIEKFFDSAIATISSPFLSLSSSSAFKKGKSNNDLADNEHYKVTKPSKRTLLQKKMKELNEKEKQSGRQVSKELNPKFVALSNRSKTTELGLTQEKL